MKICLKSGITIFSINISPTVMNGTSAMNAVVSFGLILIVIMMEKISIRGLLRAVLIIIIYEFCTLVTSVVSLVTRLDDENLSIFEKE